MQVRDSLKQKKNKKSQYAIGELENEIIAHVIHGPVQTNLVMHRQVQCSSCENVIFGIRFNCDQKAACVCSHIHFCFLN